MEASTDVAVNQEGDILSAGVMRGEFRVAPDPVASLCHGCPEEGGLCSWPLELTRRQAVDRLF